MLKQATKIKTLIGLSALSLSIAYLLTDKLIELGIIKTNFGVGMLFVFLFVFVVSKLITCYYFKKKQSAKTNSLKQTVKSGKDNKQKIKLTFRMLNYVFNLLSLKKFD